MMIKKILLPVMILHSMILFSAYTPSEHFSVHKLADGVYALIHKMGGMAIGNSGMVDLGDKTVIFDTFLSPQAAQEIPALAKKLKLSPIKYVVNSHYHNDHIRGNQVFSGQVRIISTRKTAELIKKNEPIEIAAEKKYAPQQLSRHESLLKNYRDNKTDREYQNLKMWHGYFKALAESHDNLRTRVPDLLIDKEKIIKGPRRSLKLMCLGRGHSESDLVLYLPQDKILFAGDLVFINMHPYLADGSLRDLKAYLTGLQGLEIDKLVPGHGPLGDARDLAVMKDYLRMIAEQVGIIIEQGSSMRGADTMAVPEPYDRWWFKNFFHSNLRFVLKKYTNDASVSDSDS